MDAALRSIPSSREASLRRLPRFNSPSELKGSPWEVYFKALYGSSSVADPSAFPIDVSELFALRTEYLEAAGLNLTGTSECPQRELELVETQSCHSPTPPILWVFHSLAGVKPLSDDAWVEITHRIRWRDDGNKVSEMVGYWMYYAPGSGVSYNLGRTIAFNTHYEGVKYFVKRAWYCYECDEYFAEMCRNAKQMGFQSVQFLHHHDMRCGNTAIELVDVKSSGNFQCGPGFYGGRGDSRCPCTCSENNKYLMANCKLSCPQARARAPAHHLVRGDALPHPENSGADLEAQGSLRVDTQPQKGMALDRGAMLQRFGAAALHSAETLAWSSARAGSMSMAAHSIYNTMVGDMEVATFNAARFERETPSYLAMELARLHVDVIAVQEDVGAFASDGKTLHTFLHVPGFDVAATCAAEQLRPSAAAYAWGGRVLANSLHVRRDRWEAVSPQAIAISAQCFVPRCAAIADLRLRDIAGVPRTWRVASTQVCGGDSIDHLWEQISGEKVAEIQKLTAAKPDLILGDMKSYSSAAEAKRHAVAGSHGPFLNAVHDNLASEYLDWSSSACTALQASSYTHLLGYAPRDTSIHGDMAGQIWFRSGRFLGAGLQVVTTESDHSIVHGVLDFRPERAQLTHESFVPLFVMLLPGAMFIIAGIVLNWRTRAERGATARASARSKYIWACGFAMFFLKGLCHTLLPLCFAAWVVEGRPLEVICYAAAAARVGGMLGNVCWGAVIDVCMAPRVAAATAHVVVAAGSWIMSRSVLGTHLSWIVAQFLLAFGCSAETLLTQHLLAAANTHEALGTQSARMQVGGHLGGLYASILFMACRSLESQEVLLVAYSAVLMIAILTPFSLWACSAFNRAGADSSACPEASTLWERWRVTPTYKLVVLQGIICASAYDVGSFALASVVGASRSAMSGELAAIQCICSVIGSSFFGRWSDQLARGGGPLERVVAGRAGCVASMFAVAVLSWAQGSDAGRSMALMVGLLAVKSLSEDAAYVGTTRPLLISETQPSCAAAAVALKNVFDGVAAAFSGPLILWMARSFGYVGSDEPSEVAKQIGQSIAFIYITLRLMELAVYGVMRRQPKPASECASTHGIAIEMCSCSDLVDRGCAS